MSIETHLAPPRLVVTGHTKDGTSVFVSDETIAPFFPFGPAASCFNNFHARLRVPVSNISMPPNMNQEIPRVPPGGVSFGISTFPPGAHSPMHRTLSQDYAVVISGSIACELDGGEEKTLHAGEFMVQRGVNHAWHNRTTEPCRVMFVMVAAEKIVLADGTPLEETVLSRPKIEKFLEKSKKI